MKLLRSFIVGVAIGVATLSTAQARDSFGVAVNIGGHGHHHSYQSQPVVTYYVAPQVRYYQTPHVGYHHAPRVYHTAPVVDYRTVYYGGSRYGDRHSHHNSYRHNSHHGGYH